MTVTDKAKEIVFCIRNLSDTDAAEFVRAHLAVAHNEGYLSGVEAARQALNEAAKVEAA